MSKKKGQKVDLARFLAEDVETNLPRNPGQGRSEREPRRGYGNREFGQSGAADNDNWFRREPTDDGYDRRDNNDRFERRDRPPRGDRYGDDEGPPPSKSDQSDNWRRGPPPGRDRGGPGSHGGEDGPGGRFSAADGEDNWRASRISPRGGPKRTSEADNADTWRRSGPTRTNPLAEDNWRRGGPPRDDDFGGNGAADDDDGRPKLKLKSKDDAGTAKESGDDGDNESNKDQGGDDDKQASGGDKWDNVFKKKSSDESAHLRYGDRRQDMERERAFSRRDGYGSRPGSEAFGGGRRGGMQDEDRIRGSQIFGGGRRGGDRERREFPGSDRGSGRDFERREFPGSGGGRDYERREFPGSGGGRRGGDDRREFPGRDYDRRGGDDRYAPRVGRNDEEYEGGMERIRAARNAGRGGEDEGPASPPRPPPADLSGPVGDWGDEDPTPAKASSKKEAEPKVEKNLSEEDLLARTEAALRVFMQLENKRDCVNAIKNLGSSEFMPKVVSRAVRKTFEGTVKQSKLVAGLFQLLHKEEVITTQDIINGLDMVSKKQAERNKNPGIDRIENRERVSRIRSMVELLKESKVLGTEDEISETTLLLIDPDAATKGSSDDAQKSGGADEELIVKIISDDTIVGDAAAKMVDTKAVQPNFGVAFLQKLFETKPKLVETDVDCNWVSKDKGYGKLLAKVLYEEDPSKDKLAILIQALVAIQVAFDKVHFPKAENGQALLEKVFMKMYSEDVVPPEAIIEWKDDLTDTPGKVKAIVQLSQFVTWLEAEDDDDEEDDE